MPYSDEGNYVYQVEVPASGDSLRKAAFGLAHDVESYLFDHNHPGYNQLAFLDWAVQHFLGTHQSSGMQVNRQFRWDASVAGEDVRDQYTNEKKNHDKWTGGSAVENAIRYSTAAMDDDRIDTSKDVNDDSKLYAPYEVTNPAHASEISENAIVVPPRRHEDVPPAQSAVSSPADEYAPGSEQADSQELSGAPKTDVRAAGGDFDYAGDERYPVEHDEGVVADDTQDDDYEDKQDDVIETPADEYKPVDDEDGE